MRLLPRLQRGEDAPDDAVGAATALRSSVASCSAGGGGRTRKRKLQWRDGVLDEMLRLRFADAEISRSIERAVMNCEKKAAWKRFAEVLSENVGENVSERQLRLKFAKVKWEHRHWCGLELLEERRAVGKPPTYLPILERWFGERQAASTLPNDQDSDRSPPPTSLVEEGPGAASMELLLNEAEVAQGADESSLGEEQVDAGTELENGDEREERTSSDAGAKAPLTNSELAMVIQNNHMEQMTLLKSLVEMQRAQNELLAQIAKSLAKS